MQWLTQIMTCCRNEPGFGLAVAFRPDAGALQQRLMQEGLALGILLKPGSHAADPETGQQEEAFGCQLLGRAPQTQLDRQIGRNNDH